MYLKKYFGWRCNRSDDDIRSKLWLGHYYVNMSQGLKMGVEKLKYFFNLVPRAFPLKNGWGTHFLREKP